MHFKQQYSPFTTKIWHETELSADIKEQPRIGDKASGGAAQETARPQKKPPGGELTEAAKAETKRISQERLEVEHGMRKVTGFRVVRND